MCPATRVWAKIPHYHEVLTFKFTVVPSIFELLPNAAADHEILLAWVDRKVVTGRRVCGDRWSSLEGL